jgi:hypothetical protein
MEWFVLTKNTNIIAERSLSSLKTDKFSGFYEWQAY